LFPFLTKELSKGVFLIILSLLCYGKEMGFIGIWSGVVLISSGISNIFIYLNTHRPKEFKAEPIFFEKTLYEPPAISK
jgi:hypothetical protein